MMVAAASAGWPRRHGEIPIRIKEVNVLKGQNQCSMPSRHPLSGANMQPLHVCDHTTPEALYPFDARGVAKRFRHAAIFGALDTLQPGETMRFCNDHDPLPLLAQLQSRYGTNLSIEYKQREQGVIVIDFSVVG
jgi:uncharacterized protein (DUF2249 family)